MAAPAKGVFVMAKSKRYSKEFKLEAARLVVEHGYTFKEVAKRLGATDWSIRQWVQKFRCNGELSSAGTDQPQAEELRRLRKENKRLQLENEILKKAAAYFAKDSI
jgi:transposase-like protein